MTNLIKRKKERTKPIIVRLKEQLINPLQQEAIAIAIGMSINSYIGFLINLAIQKQEVPIEEKIGKLEKKEVEI